MNRTLVKVVAVVLAVVMIGSVVYAAVRAFALEPGAATSIVNTGESDLRNIIIVVAAVAAVGVVGGILVPKFKK